jgi:preprotein translocase subunit SecB
MNIDNNLNKVQFRFINFIVKESNIVLKEQGEFNINVDFDPKGYIFKSLNQFHLELNVEVKEVSDKFNVKIKSIAIFEFDSQADLEQYTNTYFILNAPSIAFPYIRAYISNLTTQSGLFTITLPTFNLTALGDILKKNIKEME